MTNLGVAAWWGHAAKVKWARPLGVNLRSCEASDGFVFSGLTQEYHDHVVFSRCEALSVQIRPTPHFSEQSQ